MSFESSVRIESLEVRTLLSGSHCDWEELAAKPAKGKFAPEIRMDLVALHELGHSLGLDHENTSAVSIMDPYYNAGYNLANLYSDPASVQLRALYGSSNSGPWKDSADASPGNGVVNVTYSFMYDGTRLDNRKANNIFSTFDSKFGAGMWQKVFVDQVNRWAAVSNGKLAFNAYDGALGLEPQGNATLSFNTSGKAQNDSRFGDIRIGTHAFDGAGKVLAHAYLPGYGNTADGDLHLDSAENWIVPAGSLGPVPVTSAFNSTSSTGSTNDDLLS